MGFWDKVADKVKNFDYESAAESFVSSVEKKQADIEQRARMQIRQKARSASDDGLRRARENAIDEGKYIAQEEIEREMDRRGIYY